MKTADIKVYYTHNCYLGDEPTAINCISLVKKSDHDSAIQALENELKEAIEHLETVIYGEPPDFATSYPAADAFVKAYLAKYPKGGGE